MLQHSFIYSCLKYLHICTYISSHCGTFVLCWTHFAFFFNLSYACYFFPQKVNKARKNFFIAQTPVEKRKGLRKNRKRARKRQDEAQEKQLTGSQLFFPSLILFFLSPHPVFFKLLPVFPEGYELQKSFSWHCLHIKMEYKLQYKCVKLTYCQMKRCQSSSNMFIFSLQKPIK